MEIFAVFEHACKINNTGRIKTAEIQAGQAFAAAEHMFNERRNPETVRIAILIEKLSPLLSLMDRKIPELKRFKTFASAEHIIEKDRFRGPEGCDAEGFQAHTAMEHMGKILCKICVEGIPRKYDLLNMLQPFE